MRKRVFSTPCAPALCLVLLPATASAADWTHNAGSRSDRTELTQSLPEEKSHVLDSETYDPGGSANSAQQLAVDGRVALCADNRFYDYSGTAEAAILAENGASPTVCCCQLDSGIIPQAWMPPCLDSSVW